MTAWFILFYERVCKRYCTFYITVASTDRCGVHCCIFCNVLGSIGARQGHVFLSYFMLKSQFIQTQYFTCIPHWWDLCWSFYLFYIMEITIGVSHKGRDTHNFHEDKKTVRNYGRMTLKYERHKSKAHQAHV